MCFCFCHAHRRTSGAAWLSSWLVWFLSASATHCLATRNLQAMLPHTWRVTSSSSLHRCVLGGWMGFWRVQVLSALSKTCVCVCVCVSQWKKVSDEWQAQQVMRVYVCVRARARARVCVCVCVWFQPDFLVGSDFLPILDFNCVFLSSEGSHPHTPASDKTQRLHRVEEMCTSGRVNKKGCVSCSHPSHFPTQPRFFFFFFFIKSSILVLEENS